MERKTQWYVVLRRHEIERYLTNQKNSYQEVSHAIEKTEYLLHSNQ